MADKLKRDPMAAMKTTVGKERSIADSAKSRLERDSCVDTIKGELQGPTLKGPVVGPPTPHPPGWGPGGKNLKSSDR